MSQNAALDAPPRLRKLPSEERSLSEHITQTAALKQQNRSSSVFGALNLLRSQRKHSLGQINKSPDSGPSSNPSSPGVSRSPSPAYSSSGSPVTAGPRTVDVTTAATGIASKSNESASSIFPTSDHDDDKDKRPSIIVDGVAFDGKAVQDPLAEGSSGTGDASSSSNSNDNHDTSKLSSRGSSSGRPSSSSLHYFPLRGRRRSPAGLSPNLSFLSNPFSRTENPFLRPLPPANYRRSPRSTPAFSTPAVDVATPTFALPSPSLPAILTLPLRRSPHITGLSGKWLTRRRVPKSPVNDCTPTSQSTRIFGCCCCSIANFVVILSIVSLPIFRSSRVESCLGPSTLPKSLPVTRKC